MYVIYEIMGRKVGCTNNFERRMRLYERDEGERPRFVRILERIPLESGDRYAGDREWWWADVLGYSRESHYAKSGYKNITAARRTENANKGGSAANNALSHTNRVEIGRLGGYRRAQVLTPDKLSAIGRLGHLAIPPEQKLENSRRGGRRAAETTTPEQRSKNAKKGRIGYMEKVLPERRREIARLGGRPTKITGNVLGLGLVA